MAEVPHRLVTLTSPPRSSTGKIPYVEFPSGERLADSGLIIERICLDYAVDLDAGLSTTQLALGHAVRRMIEEHLYFAGIHERWITPAGYAATSRDYFAFMPFPLRSLLPLLLRRKMRGYLHAQGVGRHPDAQITRAASADLASLAELLGDHEYFHGQPSTIDATLYGFVAAWMSHRFDSAIKQEATSHANLVAYCNRMRDRYWPPEAALAL
jgi:glutathione S-transferase